MNDIKKIGVIGMGYVGIPAAVLFANSDKFDKVYGFQRNSKSSGYKINMINRGECPLKGEEPYLEDLLRTAVVGDKFECTSDFSLLSNMDAITISVQTPFTNKDDLIPDMSPLTDSLRNIGKYLHDQLIVIESTVTPGTTVGYAKDILEKTSNLIAGEDFSLAYAPERVMVGHLINNLQNHDRIIGGIDERSTRRAVELYSPILKQGKPITMTATAAEVTKTAENTLRDLQIAASNQLALYCEAMGVNFYDVKGGIDSLKGEGVTRAMLYPGAGVGGHCLTKDTYHLERGVELLGCADYPVGEPSLYTTARNINDFMPIHMYNLLLDACDKINSPLSVVILGSSFLPNTDDTRNSPSATFEEILTKNDISYTIHDPYVNGINEDLGDVITNTNALVVFTAHNCYKFALSYPETIKHVMRAKHPIIIDGRNIINADDYINKGFIYRGIGRGDKNNHKVMK